MKRFITIGLLSASLGISPAIGDLLTQVDTFDAGIQGWASGANPVHVASGGAGDNGGFLQISRPVSDPFHLAAYNNTQWTGNFLAAGISAIEMDLNALAGPSALNLRLVLWGNGGVWASQNLTPVANGWNHYSFGLTAADLVYVNDDINSPPGSGGGTGLLADTLQKVTIFQIRHDYPTPTPPGYHPDHISATLGIDNVQAIPEPTSFAYLVVATGALLFTRARRNTR